MLLKLENISLRYKGVDHNAVNNVSFSIPKNSIVSIVGHNGAGKSSLIQTIMDNLSYEGTIHYSFDKKDMYKYIRVQTQTSTFEKNSKVKDIVQLYVDLLEGNESVEDLLSSVQMLEFKDSYLNNLSGGEKQKIAVLLATIGNPKLIILDELTTGLDVMSRRMIWDLLQKIKEEKGVTILLTSHFLDEVEFLSDYVIVMENGFIKLEGSVESIINAAFNGKKQATCLVDTSFIFDKLPQNYTLDKNKLYLDYTLENEKEIYEILKDSNGFDIQLKNYTFEDAFLKTIGYKLNDEGVVQ